MLQEKKIETRSWKTNYRGPLLIHASAGHRPFHMNLSWEEPFYSALLPVRKPGKVEGSKGSIRYHLGCIIAKTILLDCVEIPDPNPEDLYIHLQCGILLSVFGKEVQFGDYTPGRFAWILGEVEPLEEPIPAKGKLGLWEFTEDTQ
jgi:hypothetical protein